MKGKLTNCADAFQTVPVTVLDVASDVLKVPGPIPPSFRATVPPVAGWMTRRARDQWQKRELLLPNCRISTWRLRLVSAAKGLGEEVLPLVREKGSIGAFGLRSRVTFQPVAPLVRHFPAQDQPGFNSLPG